MRAKFLALIDRERNILIKSGVITPQKLWNYHNGQFPDGKTVLLILVLLSQEKREKFFAEVSKS